LKKLNLIPNDFRLKSLNVELNILKLNYKNNKTISSLAPKNYYEPPNFINYSDFNEMENLKEFVFDLDTLDKTT